MDLDRKVYLSSTKIAESGEYYVHIDFMAGLRMHLQEE